MYACQITPIFQNTDRINIAADIQLFVHELKTSRYGSNSSDLSTMMGLLIDEPTKHNVGDSMWKAEENLEWSVNPWNNRLTGKH